jgi:hypothetical protein
MTLELRKKGAKGSSTWSISVEEDCVVTWTDPGKPARKQHPAAWKAAAEARKEIQKRMLSGFFFVRPESGASVGDAIYEGAFKYDADVFDFHPSGGSIAVAQVYKDAKGGEIAVVDFVTGERRTVLTLADHPALPGSQTFIHAVRFDAPGQRIVMALNDETWALTLAGGHLERLATPWESPAGQVVDERLGGERYCADTPSLARTDRRRRRWTMQDGGDFVVRDERGEALLRRDCRDASREYHGACLSPSGRLLALQILGRDPAGKNEIELWNVDEGRLVRSFDISAQAPSDAPYDVVERALFVDEEQSLLFAFLPGDRGLFSLALDGSRKCAELSSLVYDQHPPDEYGRYLTHISDLALGGDGRSLVVAGQGNVRFLEWPGGRLVRAVEEEISRARSLRFSDDERLIASGSGSGRLVVRRAAG